jgi:hypothetical protein
MDTSSVHLTDHVIRLLTEARVRVITFTPHTSQIFQIPDLTLFGLLKRRPRYELPFENDKSTAKFILRVYHDFRQTMVPLNIWGVFQALGLNFDRRTEP